LEENVNTINEDRKNQWKILPYLLLSLFLKANSCFSWNRL